MSEPDLESALSEACLRAPWPILVISENSNELWLNRCLADWLGLPPGQLIDRSMLTVAEPTWDALLDPGRSHFELSPPDRPIRYLERIEKIVTPTGCEIHYFNDVSEQQQRWQETEALQNRLRSLEIRDPDTGLLNRNATLQALDSQITRSRRYGNPLSIVKLLIAPANGCPTAIDAIRAITEEINHRLRWADQFGRIEQSCFLLILPETPETEAQKLAERLTEQPFDNSVVATPCTLECTVTGWERGDDTRRLLQRLAISSS